MKILITGATGFVGEHLASRLLEDGHEIRAFGLAPRGPDPLKNLDVEIIYADITDSEAVEQAVRGVEMVYHLAAVGRQAGYPKSYYWEVNVGGTENVLKAALKCDVQRVVHTSTSWVHGPASNGPLDERAPYSPEGVYEESKVAGERLVLDYHRRTGLPVVVIRPTSIYGPGDLRMLKFFRMIRKGIFFGNGRNLYHLVYVKDLVEGFRLCGTNESAAGECYIIGGQRYVTMNDFARLVADELGVPVPRIRIPVLPFYSLGFICETICAPLGINPPLYPRRVDFFVKNRAFDISKARRELGYIPAVDLAAGVARTAAWYRAQGYL